jgi:hypothetical protein
VGKPPVWSGIVGITINKIFSISILVHNPWAHVMLLTLALLCQLNNAWGVSYDIDKTHMSIYTRVLVKNLWYDDFIPKPIIIAIIGRSGWYGSSSFSQKCDLMICSLMDDFILGTSKN